MSGIEERPRPANSLDPQTAAAVGSLLDSVGATQHRDLLADIIAVALGLASQPTERLDLKIIRAAITEMGEANRVFAPYRSIPKVTMFGSARTLPEDPLYAQAKELAARLAAQGWMVITGAGPGIMAAGLEGAGRERSFGINIRLPAEQGANSVIAEDPKLVEMKYFFTRKLMLMKETDGFAILPGGFGTQDEAFELLTLTQTGKSQPAPIVLVDVPGGTYWHRWQHWVEEELVARGLVSKEDLSLYRITDSVDMAATELLSFYRNYHSSRFVGNQLVIRLRKAPGPERLAELSERFAEICDHRGIHLVHAMAPERAEGDHLDLERVALRFDRHHYGRLRQLIDALNDEVPARQTPTSPPDKTPLAPA